MQTSHTISYRLLLLLAGAVLLLALFAAARLLPRTSEKQTIPLPFGIEGSGIFQGSIVNMGTKGGRSISQISFDNFERSEPLQSQQLNIILIPNASDISQGFFLSHALTPNKRIFGYKYSSRNAIAEIAAKTRADNGEPLTYSELFPGQFFTSDDERLASTFISTFEAQKNIVFHPLSAVTLDKDSRYVMMPHDALSVLTVRGLYICGDGEITSIEQCDDGNFTNEDGCNQLCAIEPGYTCSGAPSSCHLLCGDGICDARNEFFTCRTDCTEDTYSVEIGGPDFPSWRESGAINPNPACQSPLAFGCVSSIVVRSYGYLTNIYARSNPAPLPFGTFKGKTTFTTTGKSSIITTDGIDKMWGYTGYFLEGPQQYSFAVSTWEYLNGTYAPPKITTLSELSLPFTIVPPETASRLQINPVTVIDEGTEQERLQISGSVAPDDQGAMGGLSIAYSTHQIYIAPGGGFSFQVWKNDETQRNNPDDVYIPYDLQENHCPVSLWLAGGNLSYANHLPERVDAYKKACVVSE